ncbi:MAG: hypothetical protein LC104_09455 [Bacteroidales bacterium]|nr:hypothetical protein [Bacteroidales bacterium]
MAETWSPASELTYLRAWLGPSEADFNRDDPRRQLEQRLTEHEPATLRHVASSVWRIALWENNLGTLQILDGDPRGWEHLWLGMECDVWRLRVLHHLHTTSRAANRGRKYRVTQDTAYGLATALALRDDTLADWCGTLLVREFEHPSFLTDWEDSPLFPFLAWLYALRRGRTIDARQAPVRSLGVYAKVIADWDDDTALASALRAACDYHCLRSQSDETDPEFRWSPYTVFPGEILAIIRVREALTGRRVRVDHPLMCTPLGTVPEAITEIADPLVERFKERVLAEEASHARQAIGNR